MYDMTGLQKFSATGALYNVTGALVVSAKVADAIASGMLDYYPHVPFGLDDIVLENRSVLSSLGDEIRIDNELHPYLVFKYLRDHGGDYSPRRALRGDFRIVVIDRRYVFQALPIAGLDTMKFQDMNLEPELELTWPARGQDERVEILRFETVYSRYGEAGAEEERKRYYAALESPISVVVINLSLAIRNTMDAIYEDRVKIRSA